MSKVIKMPLHKFFHNVFLEVKKRQDDIKRKKIEFLYKEAYRYFLDVYLMKIEKHQIVDLPPFMYETGRVICKEARMNAEQVLLDVIKANRINHCYTKRLNEVRKFTV